MEMSHHGIFEIFRIRIRAQASSLFSVRIFHEREKCTPLRSYISSAVNVGAELDVYGNVS